MAAGDGMMREAGRYDRQSILPQIGDAGQARLARAHVLVVGAGGLGVPVLQYLAAAGLGRITVIDPDRVELGNLHRQTIYGGQIGRFKAEAAADFIHRLNPEVEVRADTTWLGPQNADDLVVQADLILDCADSFAASYILSDSCIQAGRPLISASAQALGGYAGGFCAGAPSLRAVFPDLPDQLANCATAGVLGPVVGMIGCLQAQMALAVLLGMQPSPLGQLIRYEMRGFRLSSFRFDNAPEPAGPQHRFIARAELRPDDFAVELRAQNEAPQPFVPWARRLRAEDFGADGPCPTPGQRAVFACRSGLRAWRAADRLRTIWPGEIALFADPATDTTRR